MKKSILISLALFISVGVFAQKEKMVSAYEYLRHKELDKAKDRIDLACEHESSKVLAKAWKYRGDIYYAIANTKNETYKALHETPLLEAALAYSKSIELDTKGKYKKDCKAQIQNIKVSAFNRGIALIKAEVPDNKGAYVILMQAIAMDPNNNYKNYAGNVGVISNLKIKSLAASAAKDGGLNSEAIALYKEIADPSNKDLNRRYLANFDIANIYISSNDMDNAIKALEEAYTAFPDSSYILYKIYDMNAKQGKVKEQLEKMESVENKTDVHYYLIGKANYDQAAVEGITAEKQLVYMDSAVSSWNKTVELNPKHVYVNRDLGELLLARGVSAKTIADDNWNNATLSAKKDKEATEYFNQAVEKLIKHLEISPESLFTLDKIKTCYSKLKQFDKVKEYDEKIKVIQSN